MRGPYGASNGTTHRGISSPPAAIRLSRDHGYLALFSNPERSPSPSPVAATGTPGCYWHIEAPPGRTIRVAWKQVGGAKPAAAGARHRKGGAGAQLAAEDEADDVIVGDGSSSSSSSSSSLVGCSVAVMFRDGDHGSTVKRAACDRSERQKHREPHASEVEQRRNHQAFAADTESGFAGDEELESDDDDEDHHHIDDDGADVGFIFQSKSNRLEIHPAISAIDPLVSIDSGRTVADKWQPYILQYKC
jgi:hypothetical protein